MRFWGVEVCKVDVVVVVVVGIGAFRDVSLHRACATSNRRDASVVVLTAQDELLASYSVLLFYHPKVA